MKLTPELEADIRRAVNPLYVNQRGTESYERAALLGEIDRLRMRVSELEGVTAFDSALQELEARGRVIEEQRRIIEALNASIGGEGSTTLENIRSADKCKRCGADMQPGVAIGQTFTGSPDFIGGEVCTVSPGGPGKLVECMKCPECGWSVSK